MHIHILGICGTFMGGLALLARNLGHEVTGTDANVYPPMSTMLQDAGVRLGEGYDKPLPKNIDIFIIGNALSRGNPMVEQILNQGSAYTSGAEWLARHVLHDRWVLAVAGTHGKTTTSSMLAWVLADNDMRPGFLIGGVPANFGVSAELGEEPFFVIEADEYDTAFFDKRSKFVHYHPRTLIINNLEFDHADIFSNLAAIQTQFHHLVRTVPSTGKLIYPAHDAAIQETLARGCWSETESLSLSDDMSSMGWRVCDVNNDYSEFSVLHNNEVQGTVKWELIGEHNVWNALAAIVAAHHAGLPAKYAIPSLCTFTGIKRRMEVKGKVNNITVYDDFAHHPTAIATTLDGLRRRVGNSRIHAVLEPRSNTMRMGVHAKTLQAALQQADNVYILEPTDLSWNLSDNVSKLKNVSIADTTQKILDAVTNNVKPGEHVIIMSNGGFENLHNRLLEALTNTAESIV